MSPVLYCSLRAFLLIICFKLLIGRVQPRAVSVFSSVPSAWRRALTFNVPNVRPSIVRRSYHRHDSSADGSWCVTVGPISRSSLPLSERPYRLYIIIAFTGGTCDYRFDRRVSRGVEELVNRPDPIGPEKYTECTRSSWSPTCIEVA